MFAPTNALGTFLFDRMAIYRGLREAFGGGSTHLQLSNVDFCSFSRHVEFQRVYNLDTLK